MCDRITEKPTLLKYQHKSLIFGHIVKSPNRNLLELYMAKFREGFIIDKKAKDRPQQMHVDNIKECINI